MKSFFVRLASSAVILAVYVLMYLLRETVALEIIVALLSLLSVYELIKATDFEERRFLYPFALLFAAAVPFVKEPVWLAVAFVLAVFAASVVMYGKADLTHTVFITFMTVFIGLSLTTLILLRGFDKFEYTLPLVFGASVCDVFCYLCGSLFGRHKLCPDISPKKTVEGAVGGVVFTCTAFLAYAYFTGLSMPAMAVLGVLVAVFSQIGDLSASVIKRTYGIKDFSNLIPGHGGVMDRTDSWVFTAPIIYIAISLLSQTGML